MVLDTDASGIGATLFQVQYCEKSGKGEERPIAHASKSLTKAQRQYCVTRKELLAVVYFVQYFRHYLLGREFVIRTDHSALRWVMSFKDPRDQMAQWLEVLCQYKFKIIYHDGKKHSNADALSRVPCDPAECSCYDRQSVLSDLPCGGCDVCNKKHEQWSSFQEVDDVVPGKKSKMQGSVVSFPPVTQTSAHWFILHVHSYVDHNIVEMVQSCCGFSSGTSLLDGAQAWWGIWS